MYTCSSCTLHTCEKPEVGTYPKNCPVLNKERMAEISTEYEPFMGFFTACAKVEAEGYCQWPRLRETIELCKKMGYKKIGLGFCAGFRAEAKIVENLLRSHGFQVSSAVCKVGGLDKEEFGLPSECKINPGGYEPVCNPIGQAELLNDDETDFNIVLGLCVGHDSLFLKHSKALATVLVAKDRVMAHNPCGAIYTANGYCKTKL